MKRKFTKRAGLYSLLFCGILFTAVNLTGCQEKELTKEEVTETSYYKSLKNKYDNLKKEKENLEEQLKEATKTDPDDKRATTYLNKLQKDSLIKLEVAPASDPSSNSFFSQQAILKFVTKLIKKADLTFNYTPDTLKEEYEAKYIYTLYDEDNSVFEITVYEGNYIVFSDLPHKVYYCYNADLIGDAFVKTEKDFLEFPLLYELANSSIVLVGEGESLHTASVIWKFYTAFDEIEKEEMEENTQETEKKQATYTFYENGEKIILTMYQTQLSIAEEDGKEIWYRIEEKDIEKIRKILD